MLYLSFTILPSRVSQLNHFLNTIHTQTKQPDAVYVHCPKCCLRTGESYDIESIQKAIQLSEIASIVHLNIIPYDYGPMSKLYPMLVLDNIQPDDLIVVVDDDMHYHPSLIETLLHNFKHYESERAVCISGLHYPTLKSIQFRINRTGTRCELIEAAFSYIVKRSFFQADFTHWVVATHDYASLKTLHFENAFLSDDYLISIYLDKHHILKTVANGLVHRNNVFIKDDCIKSHDSLCHLNNTMQRYLRAHEELCAKGLLTQ